MECFKESGISVESGGTPGGSAHKTRAKEKASMEKARAKERATTAKDSNRQEDNQEAKVVGCHRV